MTVYILYRFVPWECSQVYGVYSTKELAERSKIDAMFSHSADSYDFEIKEWKIDTNLYSEGNKNEIQ